MFTTANFGNEIFHTMEFDSQITRFSVRAEYKQNRSLKHDGFSKS